MNNDNMFNDEQPIVQNQIDEVDQTLSDNETDNIDVTQPGPHQDSPEQDCSCDGDNVDILADEEESQKLNLVSYVLNTHRKIFHEKTCPFVEKIYPENREEYTGTEQWLIDNDYSSCKVCNPTGENYYHNRYYLLYGNTEREYLDLSATSSFLQSIGFDGGELRQARKGKDISQAISMFAEPAPTQMFCSYCGAQISGIEYYRLPDDRLRCTSCSNSLVKTKAEVEEICDRVRTNMESFFGASINVPIHIETLDERNLKKKIKCPLTEVDDHSILVLGAAVKDKDGYHIYLENGAPRISVIATFAHEMTHIWQYTHWKPEEGFPPCPPAKRLLIYEGMAKWVEIQYLYLVGESAIARREEFFTRQREDEYGIGFNLYDSKYPLSYDTIVCENSPFTKDKYPIE